MKLRRLGLGLLLLALASCGGCPLRALTGAFTTGAVRDGSCGENCERVACEVKNWGSEKRLRRIEVELVQELPSGAKNPMVLDRSALLEGGASGRVTADFHGVRPEDVDGISCRDAGPALMPGPIVVPVPLKPSGR